jgi:hypothetical protein
MTANTASPTRPDRRRELPTGKLFIDGAWRQPS